MTLSFITALLCLQAISSHGAEEPVVTSKLSTGGERFRCKDIIIRLSKLVDLLVTTDSSERSRVVQYEDDISDIELEAESVLEDLENELQVPFACNLYNRPVRHISEDELKQFVDNLVENDVNNAGNLVSLNLQARSPYNSTEDLAPDILLKVDPKAYQLPTVSLLARFYDNYIADAMKNENVTPEEIKEEETFMNTIVSTRVMNLTRAFLSSKGMAPDSPAEFTKFLRKAWFTIYSRGGQKKGSSAFEHIFLGEFKKGQVSGLHNWLFFTNQEKAKHLNYYGWTKKIDFPKKKGGIIKLRYAWNGLVKPAGSMFFGTSPELELAIYTVCFLARPNDKCNLSVGRKTFHIQTYTFTYDKNFLISSAYPQI